MLAFLLPVDSIQHNCKKSAETLEQEGPFPKIGIPFTFVLDNNTDSKMLLHAQDTCSKSLLDRSLLVFSHKAEENFDENLYSLKTHFDDTSSVNEYTYPRYWHGYLLALKPLLMIFDLWGIRIFNIIILAILILLVCWIMYKKNLSSVIIPFLIAILFLRLICNCLCLNFISCISIAIIGCILVLTKPKWISNQLLFCIFGIITVYFDFLTYPISALCFPLIILLVNKHYLSVREKIFTVLKCSLFWGIGYFGMWASKWILVSLLTSTNGFSDSMNQVSTYTNISDIAFVYDLPNWLTSFAYNLPHVWTVVFLYALMLLTPYTIIFIVYFIIKVRNNYCLSNRKFFSKNNFYMMLPYFIVALMPIVWYLFTVGHSYRHFGFTYKTAVSSIFAILVFVSLFKRKRKNDINQSKDNKKLH